MVDALPAKSEAMVPCVIVVVASVEVPATESAPPTLESPSVTDVLAMRLPMKALEDVALVVEAFVAERFVVKKFVAVALMKLDDVAVSVAMSAFSNVVLDAIS